MSGGTEIVTWRDLPYCDPWLEKKYKLYKLLYKLGLKRSCGKSGIGMWTYVW